MQIILSIISSRARISRSSPQVPSFCISCTCSSKFWSQNISKRLRCLIMCFTHLARNSSCLFSFRNSWCETARNRQLPSPSICTMCKPLFCRRSENNCSDLTISLARGMFTYTAEGEATVAVAVARDWPWRRCLGVRLLWVAAAGKYSPSSSCSCCDCDWMDLLLPLPLRPAAD